jgi:prepilin signal peptidase PulO-like enzyme (type II secretory pathway)
MDTHLLWILVILLALFLIMSLFYNAAIRRKLRNDLLLELQERKRATSPALAAIPLCRYCGQPIKPTDRFCSSCGQQLLQS